jgi:hypothetical protein
MNRLSAYFTVSVLTCSSLFTPNAAAQTIDFSQMKFEVPVNVELWKRVIREGLGGVEIDSSGIQKYRPRVAFHYPVSFRQSTFDSKADFFFARFDSIANFIFASFKDTADFCGADFHAEASFPIAGFEARADFNRATFHSTAFFGAANFHGTADFSEAIFDTLAYFGQTTFGVTANFHSSQFRGEIDFQRAVLPETLDFRNVTGIRQEVDFTYCLPPSRSAKCRIALEGADINKFKINMKNFELIFPESTITRLTGNVDKIKDTIIAYPTYDQKLSIYEQVLKKLGNDGFMDSYEILDIEYRRFKDKHAGGLTYVGGWLQDWWWDYGYAPEKVFTKTIMLWALFTVLNLFLFYRRLAEEVYAIDFLDKIPFTAAAWKRAIKKVLQVASYTAMVFFWLKLDAAKFKKGAVRQHPWLFTYLISIYVVGLVCVGFIVNIIFTR